MPFCWNCGTELKEEARFCRKCGVRVEDIRRKKEWQRLKYAGDVVLRCVLIAAFVALVLHFNLIPWVGEHIIHLPTPQISTAITEYEVMPGGWYAQIYWRETYRVYDVTIENNGSAPADEVRISLLVPGGVFAVRATPHIGLSLEAPYVAVNWGGDISIVDPVYLGNVLGWQPLGETFDVIQGDPQVSVSLTSFAYNTSWNMLVYFKTRTGMLEGREVMCSTEWFFGEKQLKYETSEVLKESYSCVFNPWSNNPYTYAESGDVGVPYAHVDIGRYNTSTPGFQNQTFASQGELLSLEVVFNFTNADPYYGAIAINVFVDWQENETIGEMYQGIRGMAGYLHRIFLFNAPTEPGRYGVRVLVSEYGFAKGYSSWNVNSSGFQLWIEVSES